MTEREFLKALNDDSHRKVAGSVFARHLKTASAGSLAGAVSGLVESRKHEIGGAIVGAALATALQYAANRPKNGGPSALQEAARSAVAKARQMEQRDRKAGKGQTFATGTAKVVSKAVSGLADVFAKHPGKGALTAAPTGVSLGMSAARLIR